MYANVESAISTERFARYLHRYNLNRDLALRLYGWNISMSAALWVPISIIEVQLRNAIHDLLTQRAGRQAWWQDSTIRLCERERSKITAAIDTLAFRSVTSPTAGQVVAATSMGLWTGLLDKGIPRDPLLSYETSLWQPRLQRAFPKSGSKGRKQIHAQVLAVQRLRNRIAHHEPIYLSPVAAVLNDIDDLARMMGGAASDFIADHSRARHVLGNMQSALTTGVPTF